MPSVLPVVHEKKLQLLDVVHKELVEAVGQDVASALVRPCHSTSARTETFVKTLEDWRSMEVSLARSKAIPSNAQGDVPSV